jgi:NADH-ubiquinone oxidoreductase chain 6
MLGVEFIAIIFLIVYVGAIAVLFLFVVMMLNIKILELDEVFWKYIPVGLSISSIFLFQIFFVLFKFDFSNFVDLFFYNGFWSLKEVIFLDSPYVFDNSFVNYLGGKFNGYYNAEIDLISIYFDQTKSFVLIKNSALPISYSNYPTLSLEITNTEMLGWLVYTYTFFIFLVVSLILLIAMIGSIVLVLNQNVNIKRQLIFRQTLKSLKSSVSLKN